MVGDFVRRSVELPEGTLPVYRAAKTAKNHRGLVRRRFGVVYDQARARRIAAEAIRKEAAAKRGRTLGGRDAVALLDRLHAAQNHFYGGGDDATPLQEVLAEEIVWHVPGQNAIAGEYHGVDAVFDYFRKRRAFTNNTFRMHMRKVLGGDGEWITAIIDGSAVIGGHEHTWSTVGLYRVRDGRIAACWLHPLDPAAFDAIWTQQSRTPASDVDTGPVTVCRPRIRPRHCDAQGTMHASRYYEYFEDAFLDWLDAHAEGYAALRSQGTDLVVVASACEHRRSPRLDDLISIDVRPVAAGRTSLSVSFTVRRDEDVLAVGHTTYVAVSGGGAVPLPPSLRAAVRQVPPPRRL